MLSHAWPSHINQLVPESALVEHTLCVRLLTQHSVLLTS